VQTLVDVALDLDEDGLTDERSQQLLAGIIGDQDIRLLLRQNRIALAKGAVAKVPGADGVVGWDIPLTCVVHSHPRCRFQWSRLTVDLTPSPSARIADMAPREVVDDRPVQITTSIGLGLKFNVLTDVLGAELSPELSRSRTVYHPQIVSSGAGFARGYWDFLAIDDRYLHADRDLRLLVATEADEPLNARFQLRAQVKLAGLAGLVPLLARSGAIDRMYRLDI
jgi:hypothetical protein